ncbi:MAG: NADH-quinone oxidoreductase subunit C [Bacteroidetes bacterium]|nr:NADH-quinone oxidoreductase subunit C [Bacteroidota bacterium]MDA0906797.1 NADH-quinone oxidoreductase subunit C [Bacteroidota bacterium]
MSNQKLHNDVYSDILAFVEYERGVTHPISVYRSTSDLTLVVPRDLLIETLTKLKEEHHFIYLVDIVGTDRFVEGDRFEILYNLIDLKQGRRLVVKTLANEDTPIVPSASAIWTNASWHEREIFDMYGVHFTEHPDLRRVYLPEDFEYYPLRKEFPLLGIPGSIDLPTSTPDQEASS